MGWKFLGYDNYKRKQVQEYSCVWGPEITCCLFSERKKSDTVSELKEGKLPIAGTEIWIVYFLEQHQLLKTTQFLVILQNKLLHRNLFWKG